jgi:hypothetical protein
LFYFLFIYHQQRAGDEEKGGQTLHSPANSIITKKSKEHYLAVLVLLQVVRGDSIATAAMVALAAPPYTKGYAISTAFNAF